MRQYHSQPAKRIPLLDFMVTYEPEALPSTGARTTASCSRSQSFPGEPMISDVPLMVSGKSELQQFFPEDLLDGEHEDVDNCRQPFCHSKIRGYSITY